MNTNIDSIVRATEKKPMLQDVGQILADSRENDLVKLRKVLYAVIESS